MSDRQTLAEHGVGLCLWGLGGIGITIAGASGLASVAVVTTLVYEKLCSRPQSRARAAMRRALKALEGRPEIPPRGVLAATQLLKEVRGQVAVNLCALKEADKRGSFPDTLYDQIFAGVYVPHDDGVEDALRLVIAEAYKELRLDPTFDALFQQESLKEIEVRLAKLLDMEIQAGEERAMILCQVSRIEKGLESDRAQSQGQHQELLVKLSNLAVTLQEMSRTELVSLAGKFGISDAENLPLGDLGAALRARAQEFFAMRADNEKLRGLPDRIDNIRREAEDALAKLDFDGASTLLEVARSMVLNQVREPLEFNAKLLERQADIALLQGLVQEAFDLLSSAADSLTAVDREAPVDRRLSLSKKLFDAGDKYRLSRQKNQTGVRLAIRAAEEAVERLTKTDSIGRQFRVRDHLVLRISAGFATKGLSAFTDAAECERLVTLAHSSALAMLDLADVDGRSYVAHQSMAKSLVHLARRRDLVTARSLYDAARAHLRHARALKVADVQRIDDALIAIYEIQAGRDLESRVPLLREAVICEGQRGTEFAAEARRIYEVRFQIDLGPGSKGS